MLRTVIYRRHLFRTSVFKAYRCLVSNLTSSSTTMASTPPRQKSMTHNLAKAPRKVYTRFRNMLLPNSRSSSPHSSALPGTSAANDAPSVVRDRPHDSLLSTPRPSSQCSFALTKTDFTDKVDETLGVGDRSQESNLPTPHPASQQSPCPELNASDKLKKAWGVTWSGLETALRLLEKSADAFPPLKSAVGGLVACLDLAQVGYVYVSNTLYLF